MRTVRFTERGPFYGCSEPGDMAGEYVPADVARAMLAEITHAIDEIDPDSRYWIVELRERLIRARSAILATATTETTR